MTRADASGSAVASRVANVCKHPVAAWLPGIRLPSTCSADSHSALPTSQLHCTSLVLLTSVVLFHSLHRNTMSLSWASRVVRGGSAVETVYWRASNNSNSPASSSAKLVKHGKMLKLKHIPPPPANLHTRLTITTPLPVASL